MSTQDLTIEQFADLLNSESRRGVIDGNAIMKLIEKNRLPRVIYDIRGAVRLMIEEGFNGLFVTKYPTALATERAVDSIVGYPDMAKEAQMTCLRFNTRMHLL